MLQKINWDWLKLIVGLCLVTTAALVLIPKINSLPAYKRIIENKEIYNIETESLFYTETDQFNATNNFMMNLNKFSRDNKQVLKINQDVSE